MLQKVDVAFTFCNMKICCALKKVVIRTTNNLKLQRNIVARQVARKMLPVLLGLKYQIYSLNWTKYAMPIVQHITVQISQQVEVIVFRVNFIHQAPVVQKVDNAIQRINHYPLDSAIDFAITYPLDSDLSAR